jgi:hypothetical protein
MSKISDALSSTAFHGPNAFGHPRRIRRPPVGPAFALTFWGVFLITILCGVANITMAAHFGTAWKMGVGALIGLLVYLTADSRDAGAGCWRESRNRIGFAPIADS